MKILIIALPTTIEYIVPLLEADGHDVLLLTGANDTIRAQAGPVFAPVELFNGDDDAIAYFNSGIAKNDLKDYEGAIADYNKAIELDPDDTVAYLNRGFAKENLGDLNGACADWRKAASLNDPDEASYELSAIESAKWLINRLCN